jgi:hypothetical protein
MKWIFDLKYLQVWDRCVKAGFALQYAEKGKDHFCFVGLKGGDH